MKKSFAIISVVLLCLGASVMSAFGQTYVPATLNVAGGSNVISGQVFEYSIGEMTLVHTATAPNIIVTQGVLQPGDIGTGITDRELADSQIKVYPNPVDDVVNVEMNLPSGGSLQLLIYDLSGKLVEQKAVAAIGGKESTRFSLVHLAAGSYVLKAVFETGAESFYRNFKLVKMN
ncbi:T9SS type A sorting domain-containing protein [Cryomorpha ignava]|uniref:T9SS type A sorting domain-containing protein n=1 Tax=Cryomorpha ignava TaxID=101383 RepID=A0A7K3WWT9_9FLAO|nr:T9SS type A sorting domain-containing protein [Cryomorpha ignava]NEN25322.1 T9SS type A sorting domain-containing protein [Cryomorpha ignava]NEN25523.1 T9SS type A sorting domain-containing protein [Cryomorpha ignava]